MKNLLEDSSTLQDMPGSEQNRPGVALEKAQAAELSWGDKYKHKASHFIRNFLVNYVVNFAISAVFTYKMTNTKLWKEKFDPGAKALGAWLEKKTGIDKVFTTTAAELVTTTQLLLMGGHSILPYMRWSHNNRQRQEYEMGKRLDKLQEAFGKGNAASRRNLEEYKYIDDLLKAGKPESLTIQDKMLLAKRNIDDNLQFKEHRQTWGEVGKARLTGVSATTALSFALAAGSYFAKEKGMSALNVKETILEGWGGKFGEKVYAPLSDFGMQKDGMRKLGGLTLLELIYTAASKLGFDRMEKRQLRKQEHQDALEAQKAIKGDREILAQSGIRPDDAGDIRALTHVSRAKALEPRLSALEERRRILNAGAAKDFQDRVASRNTESAMAVGG